MTHTIETLPFVTFTEIAKSNKLDLLLVRKFKFDFIKNLYLKYKKIDLNACWENIRKEYSKHEDSKKDNKIKQLQVKLRKLNSKYYPVIAALEVLRYGKDDEMLKLMKEYGYVIKGDYWQGLELIFKQAQNFKNKIDGVKSEIKKYMEHGKSDNETNIYETLTNLALGLELNMSLKNITTIEYIFYRKAFLKKIEQNKK